MDSGICCWGVFVGEDCPGTNPADTKDWLYPYGYSPNSTALNLAQCPEAGISLVVQWLKTLPSTVGGTCLIPGWEAKIPDASQPKHQNIKQKQYCNTFNKDFKNGPH